WSRQAEAAIADGNLRLLRRLLAEPAACPDARISGGCGLAQVAAHWGRPELLACLLAAGCPAELPDNDGDTALTEAAACGHTEVLELLLRLDRSVVNPERANRSGCTALHAACQRKHLKSARLLLDLGSARPGRLDAAGNSALHALAARSAGVLSPADACLNSHGRRPSEGFASIPNGSQQPSLSHNHQASAIDIVQLMHDMLRIDPSLSLDQVNSGGYTPLMKCVATGHWTLLPHLLRDSSTAPDSAAAATSTPRGCRNRDGFNLAHVFYAHHDDSTSSRAAASLLLRCLGPQRWAEFCAERVTTGPHAGYSCLHFACEFGRLAWLLTGLRLTGERTNRGESAVDILARRRQLVGLRQRCSGAEPSIWRQTLLLLDPVLGSPRPRPDDASRARARRLLGPLCAASDEHDSGRLFRQADDDGRDDTDKAASYESGQRYWQTGGRERRQYPLPLRLLVAAIGEDSPEAFVSLLELGHLDGAWSSGFCCDLLGYLATDGGTSALPYIGKGLAQLRPEHLNGADCLDPLDLAVSLGRSRIVEEMLLARPFDLVPSCLRVLLMCTRMRQVRHRCVADMRQSAESVLVNALNSLHDGATSEKERQRIDAYVHGEINGEGPTFSAIELPVLREGRSSVENIESAGQRYTILQLLLAAGCDEALSTRCIRMLVKRRWVANSGPLCHSCGRSNCCSAGRRGFSPSSRFILHAASLAVFTVLFTVFLLMDGDGDSASNWQQPTAISLLLVFVVDHLVLGCVIIR
uniref:ANK_REP_REGION domain-containing protein n=2 Tax=Macrostomum lignano TaxID=282301 RepID=A0A1I8H0X3_9PLAT